VRASIPQFSRLQCIPSFLCILLASTTTAPSGAQATLRAPDPVVPITGFAVTVNPLGFLQHGPTVDVEVPIAPRIGVVAGGRMITLGALSYVLDPDLRSGWSGSGSLRIYLKNRNAHTGWWIAPRYEWGRTDSGGTEYTGTLVGAEVGYRWLFTSRKVVSLGFLAGTLHSESEDGDDGLSGAIIAGVLSVGIAR
jgi:hypothetical protein